MGEKIFHGIWIVFKAAWIAAVVYLLLDTRSEYGFGMNFTVGILILTFPSGLIWLLILVTIDSWFSGLYPNDTPENWFTLAATWVGWFAIGYIQWFILLPRFVNWIRRKVRGRKVVA